MEILKQFLTIVFIINCFLLILAILLQSGKSSGMSLFGGGSQTPFGASSADVLTKITGYMTAAFLTLGFVIAYLKTGSKEGLEDIREEIIKNENVLPDSQDKPDKQKNFLNPQNNPETKTEGK